jgi:hypothetical protein
VRPVRCPESPKSSAKRRIYEITRYEWSIFSGSGFHTSAKPTSNWLEKNLRAVSYGRIHVTNFKTLSSTKALEKLCTELYQSPAKALHEAPYKALQKLYQRLCSTSAHPVYWPLSEWSTQCAVGSKRVSPLKLCSKLCSKLYLKPYTELQSSTNAQH